ncbi:MAG: hypothetical protein HYX60_07290 [Legionella longbeachae]|nr:hypothetical protein [Legionella longbeachae]
MKNKQEEINTTVNLQWIADKITAGYKLRNPHLSLTFELYVEHEKMLLKNGSSDLKDKLLSYIKLYFLPRIPNRLDYLFNDTDSTTIFDEISLKKECQMTLQGQINRKDIHNFMSQNRQQITDKIDNHFFITQLDQSDPFNPFEEFKYRLEYIRGGSLPEQLSLKNFIFPVSAEGAGEISLQNGKVLTPTTGGLALLANYHQHKYAQSYPYPAYIFGNTDDMFNKIYQLSAMPYNFELYFMVIAEGGIPKQTHEKRLGRWSGHRTGVSMQKQNDKLFFILTDSLGDSNQDNTFMREISEQIEKIFADSDIQCELVSLNKQLQFSPIGCTSFTQRFYNYLSRMVPNSFEKINQEYKDQSGINKYHPPASFLSLAQSMSYFNSQIKEFENLKSMPIHHSQRTGQYKNETLIENNIRHVKLFNSKPRNEKISHFINKEILQLIQWLTTKSELEIRQIFNEHCGNLLDENHIAQLAKLQEEWHTSMPKMN